MTTPRNDILFGDVRERLRELDEGSVDCIITSPPYWSLRKYDIPDVVWDGVDGCEHKWESEIKKGIQGRRNQGRGKPDDKEGMTYTPVPNTEHYFCSVCGAWKGQLGLEPTIDLYLKHLLSIMDECERVLRDDGTMWVNLGDSYAGSWGDSGHRPDRTGIPGHQREKNTEYFKRQGHPTDNPPTSRKQNVPNKSLCLIPERFSIEMVNRGWILRNKIIWHKPNCMPASVKDRFTVDWEPVYFFVKSRKYWFEQQYEAHQDVLGIERFKGQCGIGNRKTNQGWSGGKVSLDQNRDYNPNGRNRRCVWTMTKEEWLESCAEVYDNREYESTWRIPTQPYPESHFATFPERLVEPMVLAGCPKGGLVLDPFIGSGTIGKVATGLERDFLGIELGDEYVEMAWRRILGIKKEQE